MRDFKVMLFPQKLQQWFISNNIKKDKNKDQTNKQKQKNKQKQNTGSLKTLANAFDIWFLCTTRISACSVLQYLQQA